MKKKIFNGLASLILPLGAYANIAPTGAYNAGQRSYLRSGPAEGMTLDTSRFVVGADNLSTAAEQNNELALMQGNPVRELMVIDSSVPDKHVLYREARPGVEIVEIDSGQPGLSQLIEVLAEHKNLSALHIVSHAQDGVLLLGNSKITSENIKHKVETFAALNHALREGADLLIYGCNLAAGENGAEFLDILAANTHLDIAASDDVTGNSAQGGDWELEIHKGNIETQQPFSQVALRDFSSVLLDQTITMGGFATGFSEPKTATYGAYTARLSLDSGDPPPNEDSLYCYAYYGNSRCIVDYSGASIGDKKLYFDFTGGEQFNVTSFTLYSGYLQNFRVSSDNGDTTDVELEPIDGITTLPLNWTGITRLTIEKVDGSDITYARIDDIVLTNIGPAPDNDATLTAAAGVTEPVGLATTIDTVGETVDVFDFTISDGGTADGLATTVSQIVVNVGGTSTDAERSQITWRLNGPGASNVTGTYNAGTDTITFSGLGISVADGGNETYTINAYFNDSTNVVEDRTIILNVNGDDDLTVGASGTQMSGANADITNGTGTTIDVVASGLALTTQPAGSVSGSALTTQPVVTARDAFGNTDVDFTETITLTEASPGTLTNNTQAATSGVATFTNLIYTATADQQSFTLTANDQDGVGSDLPTVDANAVISDVVATQLVFDTQPAPTSVINGQATNFTTVPVVSARDANNIVDTGHPTDITLAEVNGLGSATLTGTGDTDGNATTVSISPASGAATFTGLQITYINMGATENFNLRASSGGLTIADSDQFTSVSPPTVTDGNISISGASGTGGAFRIGDTVTATWNNTGGGDNNAGITGVTVDFTEFGGGAAVVANESSGTWTATYTIVAGAIDATNRNVSVTATNAVGPATTADTTNATVDNETPTVTDTHISISGASGTGGAYKIGDTVTAIWNNTAGGDNNSDTVSEVTVDFSAFGGSAAEPATNSSDTWTATYTIVAGAIDGTNINVSVTGTDNAGNTTTTADTTSATVDNITPTVTDPNISLSGASGSGGIFISGDTVTATWNNTAGGDNNSDTVSGVTVDFSAFGGSAASVATNSSDTWTATYTIDGSSTAGSNLNVSVTATDNAGNTSTTADSTNAQVDNVAPSGHSVSFDQTDVNNGNHTAISFSFTAAEVGADYSYTLSSSAGGTPVTGTGTVASAGQTISGLNVSGLNDGTLTLSVTLTDSAGNAAGAVTDTISKDANAPTVDTVAVTNGDFAEGATVTVTVTLTEDVTVAGGSPTISIDIGATTRQATFTGEAGGVLTFSYTVQATDNTDGTGVTVLANSIDLTGGITVEDAGGNSADLSFNQVSNANAQVDTELPAEPVVTDPAGVIDVNTPDYELAGTHAEDGVVINLYADADNNGVADNATVLLSTSVSGGAWAMTHTLTANSDNNFVVVAEDAAGNTSAAVDVPTITHDNLAPAAPAAPDLEAASDSGASDTDDLTNVTTPDISGTAEANATVTLSSDLDGEVGTVSADGTGNWTLTTSALSEGVHSLTLVATDAAGNESPASAALGVTVDTTGPSLSALADQRLVLGDSTGALAFTLGDNVSAPAAVTLTPASSDTAVVPLGNILLGGSDGNRTVEITGAAFGVSTVDIEAADEAGNTATESLQVRINTPPAISGSGADSLEAGTPYSFTPNASDVDGDTLTFSISNRPSWASFNTATGRLSGTPTSSGSFSGITISVSDGLATTALAPFTISVSSAANTSPAISGTPPTQVTVGQHYHFAPTATDADGDSLSFSASGVPAWLLFDAATGSISGMPGDAQVGTHSNIVISVSDGTDSAALAAFSITVAAGEDSDDDGVSDYQEGLDETDPNDPEDYVDTDAPQLTAPAPLVLNAEGLFTAISLRQLLGLEADADEAAVSAALTVLAQDRVDGEDCCLPEVQGMSEGHIRLRPGRQLVTWMAIDRKGNEALAEQTVDVRPLVSFGKGRQVGEGGTATIAVLLNGPAPVYPFTVPYVIDPASTADAADHNLTSGSATFTETEGMPQMRAEIVVDTFLDETTEGDETVLLRLDNSSGSEPPAADAAPDIHNINVGRGEFQLTISEANLAPQAQLRLWQAETTTVQVVQTAGEVTVAASVSDPNPLDSPTLSWTGTDTALLDLADEGDTQLTFDPAALAVGAYRVRALATDSAGASGSAVLDFVVLSEPPPLSEDEDSDGDGLSDAEEGSADSNGNGIPDYLDSGFASNVLPLQVDEPDRYLAECEPGTECRLGRAALTGNGGGILISVEALTAQSIDEDTAFEPVGGIFDFEIDNLPSAGLSAEIVLPLTEAIPAEAVYRKYLDGEWVDFTEDSRNSLASAPGEPGYCPSLTLPVWEEGLNEGYHCVRLQIEDGGPNDADGEANSAIADPGAVSIAREDDGDGDGGGNGGGGGSPSGGSSGGGGAIGLWWLPLLLAGRLRRRRKNTG